MTEIPAVPAYTPVKQYKEWAGSVHSLAFVDPIYQGELSKAGKAVGHEVTRQCEGCHSPAGMVTGEIQGAGNSGLNEMALARQCPPLQLGRHRGEFSLRRRRRVIQTGG
jgi:hypothetical protein